MRQKQAAPALAEVFELYEGRVALGELVRNDLNHEALRRGQEVSYEPPEQRYLPTNDNAQVTPADARPKTTLL